MRNKFEERVAAQLGDDWQYEKVKLTYTLTCNYTPDFTHVDPKQKRIVEAKGLWDAADRRKMKAIRAQYPDWSIHMVFTNPEKTISKTSKTRYRDICEKLGITWAQGPKR